MIQPLHGTSILQHTVSGEVVIIFHFMASCNCNKLLMPRQNCSMFQEDGLEVDQEWGVLRAMANSRSCLGSWCACPERPPQIGGSSGTAICYEDDLPASDDAR